MEDPKTLEPLVSEVVLEVKNELDDRCFSPRNHWYLDKTLLAILSKLIRLNEAVCWLVKGGFDGEAFATMRSCCEAFLILKFISNKNSEERASRYVNFAKVHIKNQEEIRKVHFPKFDEPTEEKKKWIAEAIQKFGNTGSRWEAPQNMATEKYLDPREKDPVTGEPFQAIVDYIGRYEHTSHFVHVNSLSLNAHMGYPGEQYKAFPYPNADMADAILAMHGSLSYLFMGCIIVFRHFGTELSAETRQKLFDVLEKLHKGLPPDKIIMKMLHAAPPAKVGPAKVGKSRRIRPSK
jgi:hypothetical protein